MRLIVALRSTTNEEAGGSVQPTRLELPLLDPQVARELGIVAARVLDEALRFRGY